MSQYRTLNRAVWVKVESSSGEDAIPTAADNGVLMENPNSNLNLNTFDTNEVTGSLDRKAPIPSTGNAGFSGRHYLFGSGSAGTVLPEVDPLLKACGFSPSAIASAVTGTAQAGAAGSITLAAGASSTANIYRGCVITTTGGTGPGQTRQVLTYNGTTKVATVTPNWTVTPDNTTTYAIPVQHVYRQVSSSIPTVTIYEWLTRTDGGDSKLRAQVGAAGTFTFAAQVGSGCYFDFTMTGSLVQPEDDTPPSATTYDSNRPIAFVDALTCALDGTSIALDNFSFDAGNEVSQINDPRADYGLGVAGIVRRGAGGTFRAPMELESVRNVFDSWKNGTEAVLSFIWGTTAGNRFAVLSDHMVYSSVSDADVNGFLYAETPFRCNQPNDSFMITYW
jgi:hypothetical protein